MARHRVAVLEWPYREEAEGPPRTHRLEPETIARYVREAGFLACEEKPLLRTVLYLLTP